MVRLLILALAIALGVAAGCYSGPSIAPDVTATGGTAPASSDNGDPTAASSGLPCDVATLLANACTSCHGTTLAGGAPNALLTRDDLMAASRSEPAETYAKLSVTRMKDAAKPMPPNGTATDADVAVLQQWIDAGYPVGTCSAIDGGSGNYDTPLVCTSDRMWTRGDHGSSSMHPGVACIDCHSQGQGPRYTFAGTLFPTAHEPDDCYGYGDGDVTVVIKGADGVTVTLTPNSAGNFATRSTVVLPYTASVVRGDQTREMITSQRSGDCNACHSTDGNKKAPGRILAP